MNAIISGKQEAQANTVTIDTIRDLGMITSDGQVVSISSEERDSGEYYLYFIDYYNHIMLLNLRSLMTDEDFFVYMQNNQGYWKYINFVYSTVGDNRIIFHVQNYNMSTILTKFAIVKIS